MYGVDEKYILDNFDTALEKGYIKPFFQPIIRSLTGEICSAETLARWDDPAKGLLPPDVFIGILEEHGLIYKLDLKILDSVCRGYNELLANEIPLLPFSVNLSRLDFDEEDFFDKITEVFEKYNVPKNAIFLEITESVTLENTDKFSKIFERFRNAGFDMWLDDFGSGYTSLNVLKDYDFDLLKIDLKFLSNIGSRSKILISSVINMAKSLGMHVLAEGVETPEQALFLKNMGCEMLQGYYFAKPMSPKAFVEFIKASKIPVESTADRPYQNSVGRLNFLSIDPFEEIRCAELLKNSEDADFNAQYPLALLEYSDGKLSVPYMNSVYFSEVKKLGIYSHAEMIRLINDRTKSYFYDTIKQIESTIQIDDVLRKDYMVGDICYSFATKLIAKTPQKTMIGVSLRVFGENGIEDRYEEINKYGRSLFYNFELINMLYPNRDNSKQVYSNTGFKKIYGTVSLRRGIKEFAQAEVFIDDVERYIEFMDLDTLIERIAADECQFVQQPFRIRTPEGSYRWRLVRLTRIPTVDELCFMYSIQRMPPVDIDVIEREIAENPDMFKR